MEKLTLKYLLIHSFIYSYELLPLLSSSSSLTSIVSYDTLCKRIAGFENFRLVILADSDLFFDSDLVLDPRFLYLFLRGLFFLSDSSLFSNILIAYAPITFTVFFIDYFLYDIDAFLILFGASGELSYGSFVIVTCFIFSFITTYAISSFENWSTV